MDLASEIRRNVRAALVEDVGSGDLTAPLVPSGKQVQAVVVCRQKAILCGQPWFDACVRELDPSAEIVWAASEGASVAAGSRVCAVRGEARALLSSSFVDTHARVAPSGDWLVYTSNETGRLEVYTDRFPGGGAKRLISSDGGGWPRWSRDGSEIFYLTPDNELMVVAVRETDGRLEAASPQRLFTACPRPGVRLDAYDYDVATGAIDRERMQRLNFAVDGEGRSPRAVAAELLEELRGRR